MPFGSLWLPVLVASVAVFVLSSVSHMLLEHHRADYRKLPAEDAVADAIRKAGPLPGLYFIPHAADLSQMKDPVVIEKFAKGPVATLTVLRNGPPNLGVHLVQWFALSFLISFIAAYVARHTLSFAADGLTVMRITGTVAFAGYALGYVQDSIWKGIPWANSVRGMIDASVYAFATGIVFRLLWPSA